MDNVELAHKVLGRILVETVEKVQLHVARQMLTIGVLGIRNIETVKLCRCWKISSQVEQPNAVARNVSKRLGGQLSILGPKVHTQFLCQDLLFSSWPS